jgi:hypothetical protein
MRFLSLVFVLVCLFATLSKAINDISGINYGPLQLGDTVSAAASPTTDDEGYGPARLALWAVILVVLLPCICAICIIAACLRWCAYETGSFGAPGRGRWLFW